MISRSLFLLVISAGAVFLVDAIVRSDESPAESAGRSKARKRAGSDEPADSKHRVPVAFARDRATQLHSTIELTLHAMHRHYFQRGRATLPARALQDVFDDIGHDSHVDVRWISVNTRAMTIDHEPETEFEKRAAKELSAGKDSFELVEDGTYRRAGSIPLGGGCIGCHTSTFAPGSKTPRMAGLVVSIPISAD